MVIFSKEKEKERKREIIFDENTSIIEYKKLLSEEKPSEKIPIEFPVYDELSSFVGSWLINYRIQKEVAFPVLIKGKKEAIHIKFEKEISCKFENEEKNCLEVMVLLPKKSELLERSNEVILYVLEDKRFPVELKGILPILGSLKGKLKKVTY